MNFLEAGVEKGSLDMGGLKLALPNNISAAVTEKVVVGIRPEDIVPAGDGMPLKVVINENLGQSTLVHGMLAGKRVTAKFRSWCEYKRGDVVNVAFEKDKTHVFDKATGVSLTQSGRVTA
jgi:ABC-type sugar transport system ATPase subunit